jgi:hypothetical protein
MTTNSDKRLRWNGSLWRKGREASRVMRPGRLRTQGIEDDHRNAVDVEGAGGEGKRLDALQLDQTAHVYQIGRRHDSSAVRFRMPTDVAQPKARFERDGKWHAGKCSLLARLAQPGRSPAATGTCIRGSVRWTRLGSWLHLESAFRQSCGVSQSQKRDGPPDRSRFKRRMRLRQFARTNRFRAGS